MIIASECDGLRRQVEDCIASAYTKGYKKGTADAQAQKHNDAIWDALIKVYNMDTVPDYAKSIIGDVMLLLDEPDKEDSECQNT